MLYALLNKNVKRLPGGFTTKDLSDKFVNFFRNKVLKIHQSLDENAKEDRVSNTVVLNTCNSRFVQFEQVSEEEVNKPITSSPSKSCKLDCIPTWLMKTHIDAFISFHLLLMSLTVPLLLQFFLSIWVVL